MSDSGNTVYGGEQQTNPLKRKHSDNNSDFQLALVQMRASVREQELKDLETRLEDTPGGSEDEAIEVDLDNFKGSTLKRPRSAKAGKAAQEISALRKQHETFRTYVVDLESQIEKMATAVNADDAGLEIASLRGELEDAKDRLETFKKLNNTDAERDIAILRTQLDDTKAQLETYKTAEAALRQQLGHTGAKDMADGVYIDALKSQIKDLTAAQSHMQITTNNYKSGMEKAIRKQERVEEKLEARDAYVVRLKSQLQREKDARTAAESKAKNKGGCSSKVCQSCKYCNPVVVDLMDCCDADDEEDIKPAKPTTQRDVLGKLRDQLHELYGEAI